MIPEMVPRARRPYTSAVKVLVKDTVAIQENPANAAKSHSPTVAGINSKAMYPQPLYEVSGSQYVFPAEPVRQHPRSQSPRDVQTHHDTEYRGRDTR